MKVEETNSLYTILDEDNDGYDEEQVRDDNMLTLFTEATKRGIQTLSANYQIIPTNDTCFFSVCLLTVKTGLIKFEMQWLLYMLLELSINQNRNLSFCGLG